MSKNSNRSNSKINDALYNIGRNKKIRSKFINFLKNSEKHLSHKGSKRDEIIGPIVDALHNDNDTYTKLISGGLKIKFFYRSKIAREFLLSNSKKPSHIWEPQTTKLLLYLSKNLYDDVLIGGAYFGDQAILISKNIYSRSGTVHCFEPNEEQNKMLNNNIKINHIKNIKVNKYGLWSQSKKRLKLVGYDSFANSILAPYSKNGFQTITIDEYCITKKKKFRINSFRY